MPDRDSPERQLEVGRLIRPYLQELLGQEEGIQFDRVVAHLLALAKRDRVGAAARLLELVNSRPATRTWANLVLADDSLRPPDVQEMERRGLERPGRRPVPARRFVCPNGDYVWYQRTVGEAPPPCPDDGAALVLG